jgi:hypothetical protein
MAYSDCRERGRGNERERGLKCKAQQLPRRQDGRRLVGNYEEGTGAPVSDDRQTEEARQKREREKGDCGRR